MKIFTRNIIKNTVDETSHILSDVPWHAEPFLSDWLEKHLPLSNI